MIVVRLSNRNFDRIKLRLAKRWLCAIVAITTHSHKFVSSWFTHALGTGHTFVYMFVYLCFAMTCLLFINLLINKCSWLVNHAAAADTNQRNTHNTNYNVGATTSQIMLTTWCECTLKCSTRRCCIYICTEHHFYIFIWSTAWLQKEGTKKSAEF